MTLIDFRNKLVLFLVGLYLILNYGFMLIRIPPGTGSGVPIGEVLLFLYFATFLFELRWITSFSKSIYLLPFVIWWILGIGRALIAVPEYGMWALRDATHVIESLFLWAGFLFAINLSVIDRFFTWLQRLTVIGSLYALTFPFAEALKEFSPSVRTAAGNTATILFNYTSSSVIALMEASRRLILPSDRAGIGSLIIAALLIAYVIVIFQARTVYLQVIALMLLFAWYHRTAFKKINFALLFGTLAFIALGLSGIEVSGRIGRTASLEFIINHFLAIGGIENEGVTDAARGVGLRLKWWAIIWRRINESIGNSLFGLGYGLPLVDFKVALAVSVREPHNSYLSVLGRMGFIGLIVFTWGHFLLVRAWFQAYTLCKNWGYRLGQNRLLLFMVFFVLVWVYSLGEDAFEKPYFAIPYYFFWGIVLHYRLHLIQAFSDVTEETA